MNKELVEKMREAVENSYDRVPNTGIRLLNPTKVAEQCAAVASEHYGDKWTRVEDGLPENAGEYLVYREVRKEQFILAYEDGRFYYAGMAFKGVTHWQPLPQPPQQ